MIVVLFKDFTNNYFTIIQVMTIIACLMGITVAFVMW
jgi:hypothetical protein